MSFAVSGSIPTPKRSMRSAYPKLTGMLVVDDVQPGSGADGMLSPGDILVAIDGKPIPEFFALEDVLDSHVGRQVSVEVQRGRETLRHALDVQSFSAITADEYIEFGEAVVHTLSYQQARHFNVPIKGVYIANPGYVFGSAGIPRAALISSFNGKKVDEPQGFRGCPRGSRRRRTRAGSLCDSGGSARRPVEGHPHGQALVPGAQVQARRRFGNLALHRHQSGAGLGRASNPPRRSSPRPAMRASIGWRRRW